MADEDKYLNQEYDKFIKKISSEGNLYCQLKYMKQLIILTKR